MTLVLLLLLLLLFVIWIMLSINRMLKIHRRLASVRLHPEQVPLSSNQPLPLLLLPENPPLVLTRQVSRSTHITLLTVWFGTVVLITQGALISPKPTLPATLVKLGEILVTWSLLWAIIQGLVTLFLYQRIEACESGLLVRRGMLQRHISWDQARLFTIDANLSRTILNQYELSGPSQIVRWECSNTKGSFPQFTWNPPLAEYQPISERLRSYIHKNTGLPLRDLRPLRS